MGAALLAYRRRVGIGIGAGVVTGAPGFFLRAVLPMCPPAWGKQANEASG